MKIRLLTVCSAVVIALSSIMSFAGNAKKEDKDWAQFYRYAGKNDSLTMAPTVVFMGNSITDNWAKMRPDFFEKHNIAGRGISGQVSSQMLVRFHSDVVNLHPNAVVILSGTNDIARNNGYITLEHICDNIKSMCQLAKYNGIVPIIASVLPCAGYSWRKDLSPAKDIKALNEMLKEYAEKNGFVYVDYYSMLVDKQGGLPECYTKDGCHPNEDAYKIMEEIVLKAIKPYVR